MMKTKLGRLALDSPITVASGTFGMEYFEIMDVFDAPILPQDKLGAYICKTITPLPKAGNPPPRIYETECGMLNSIGLPNPGLQCFLDEELPILLEKLSIPLIVSFSGGSVDEFCMMLETLEKAEGIAGYEINVSCPNVENEGIAFGADSDVLYQLVSRLAPLTNKELIVKLSPNVTDIGRMAQAAEAGGASSISLINTLWGMAIDWQTGKARIPRKVCGYSGKGIKPVALALTYQAAQAVSLPILAMGGISCWQDALEFIYAGASAVAVGTSNFTDPSAPAKIYDGLLEHLKAKGSGIKDLIGTVS